MLLSMLPQLRGTNKLRGMGKVNIALISIHTRSFSKIFTRIYFSKGHALVLGVIWGPFNYTFPDYEFPAHNVFTKELEAFVQAACA